jgi:hypothetical protein
MIAGAVYVTFAGLAHSDVLLGLLGASVIYSSAVTTQIACWLKDPTSLACIPAKQVVVAAASELNPEDMRPAPGRLAVEPPTTGWIGQPLTLRIAAAGGSALRSDRSVRKIIRTNG